jgi:hypothetical protein
MAASFCSQIAGFNMATFAVHLLGGDGRIITKKVVRAIRNYEAVAEAKRLCAAVSKCSGFELWRGSRMLVRENMRS